MTTDTTASPKKSTRVLLGITALFVLAGAAYAVYYVTVLSQRAETDNAYVGGNLVTLSSQVAGSVLEIDTDETRMVQAGATLIKLDPVDPRILYAATFGGGVMRLTM